MTAWDDLDDLIDGHAGDVSVRLEVATDCAWSCELRYTADPNTEGPDRSHVLFAVGGSTAKDALAKALADSDWLTATGHETPAQAPSSL